MALKPRINVVEGGPRPTVQPQKIQVLSRTGRPLPEMSDESAVKYRARLIELGLLTANTEKLGYNERPTMSDHQRVALREKLYRLGLIKPKHSTRTVH